MVKSSQKQTEEEKESLGAKYTFCSDNSKTTPMNSMKITMSDKKDKTSLQNGETLNTNTEIEMANEDLVIQDGGDVSCNIDMQMDTNLYRTANMNIMDSIDEQGEAEEQDIRCEVGTR